MSLNFHIVMHTYNVCVMYPCVFLNNIYLHSTSQFLCFQKIISPTENINYKSLSVLGPIARVQMAGQLWKGLPIYILIKHSLLDLD